ncbi:MAG: AAA family ATPase [Spiroplasma ixodetis]|nr:AAA family ATPase [Spiroplasma ixodetis]
MNKILKPMTKEQENIIKELENNNLIIEAVAGSGKTTTSLYIANHYESFKILLLTYNAKLKKETRKKVKSLDVKNLEVHSFHAFGYKYYKEKRCSTDSGIYEIINSKEKPKITFNFDLIIIDEAQDITPLYYEFICKIIFDNGIIPKICLLGDKNQSIYSYNNADSRYLSLADCFFNFDEKKWNKCSLSETFRVNDKVVDFINEIFYQKKLMKSFKVSKLLPDYIVTDIYGNNDLYEKIKEEIIFWGVENIFILAASLKSSKSPVRNFANRLANDGIKIFVPTTDDENIDEKDLKGKLVFSTFHQVKGLERKLVIVFGFDNGYFKFYDKNHNTTIPPNVLYVAITRASEKLILIHHFQNDFLPFLNVERLEKYCNLTKLLNSFQENKFNNLKNVFLNDKFEKKDISVTELVRHVPQNILNKCINLIKIEKLENQLKNDDIKFKTHVKEKGYEENVSTITGIAIPLYYEWTSKEKIIDTSILKTLLNFLSERKDFAKDNYPDLFKYEKFIKNLSNDKKISIKNLLILSNLWNYVVDKFNFKLNQISEENYNWIDEKDLEKTKELMNQYVSKNSFYEQEYRLSEKEELHDKTLVGFIDCIDLDKQNLWEFKCVSLVKEFHFLQLTIYIYLFETKRNMKLQNLFSEKSKIFDKNFIEVGNEIEFKKINKKYIGEVIKIKNTKIEIKTFEKNKIIKITRNNFIKNISYEKNILKEEKELNKKFSYFLLNIKKNEIYKLNCNYENLKKIVDWLIWNKYFEFGKKTEIEFMNFNTQIKTKYFK